MRDSANRLWPALGRWGVSILALAAAGCGQEVAGVGTPGATGGANGAGGAGGPGTGGMGGGGPPPVIEQGVDPGRVGIHRLNNTEYDNTVRDLLGTASKPASKFLAEEGLHFDNTASALGMTGPQYETYFGAARDLLEEATAAAKYLKCTPASAGDACARQIITEFGFKVYRRPLDEAEIARAMKIYDAELARSASGPEAIKLAVRAMMSGANFLYRIEYDADPSSIVPHALSPYELASRLSYMGWSTMPDDTLFDLAKNGNQLLQPATLEAQVDRMLDDQTGKVAAFIESFAGQWLDLRKLPTHSITPTVFTTYTNSLADAMLAEGQAWFSEFAIGNRPLSEWFTADINFVTDELAQHYGMGPQGAGMQPKRVEITTDQRRGFLGLGSFLTHTSFPSRTSPTLRGVWVVSELLCQPPPPPPNDIPKLEASATPEELNQPAGAENVKARLARHRTEPACAACHRLLDPIGLGLERYDGIGRYREAYGNGDPIVPDGMLPEGTAFSGPEQLGALLGQDPRFTACVESKLFTYALGRDVEELDTPTLEKLAASWSARGPLTLRNLMKEVVLSNAFRFRRGEAQ